MVEETSEQDRQPPPGTPAAFDPAEQLIRTLTAYGATHAQVGREFAASAGLHSTDATALVEILAAEERGHPLTPARLSERIGLTFGSTSTLLNRLEAVDHIERIRDQADRRVVTLRTTPGVHEIADRFFQPLGEQITELLSAYPEQTILEFDRLLRDIRDLMSTYPARADQDDATTAP